MTQLKRLLGNCFLALMIGCASSTIADVPHLSGKAMKLASWKTLTPRDLSFDVSDERSYRKNSTELVSALSQVLTDHFSSADFQVQEGSPKYFTLTVFDRVKMEKVKGSHSCVKLKGMLLWEGKGKIWAESTACFGVNHNLPLAWGSNISKAYEVAFQELFQQIDQKIAKRSW